MLPPPGPESRPRRLLPTLCNQNYTSTTGCGKAPRGLRAPLEVPCVLTRIVGSLGSIQGQCGSRCFVHASRQLSDKVLRYLKRVIVTPAVYRSFVPLNRSLRYLHWAEVTDRIHRFRFAISYVFSKQSEPPSYCNQPNTNVWLTPLFPKFRGQFAEFP